MEFTLKGARALITGGASGIGLATARALGARGCRLIVADIESAALDRAVAELNRSTEAVGVLTDVSERESVVGLAGAADEHFGGVDILFLNAGVGARGAIVDASHDDWAWMLGVNLWGPIHGVEVFVDRMVASGRPGHVIFTSSFAGLVANEGSGVYSVAKYGVVALAEVLHRELRDTAVRVSVVCPMLVETQVGYSARNRQQRYGGPGELVDGIGELRDATRVIRPEEVAARIVEAIGTDQLYIVTHAESRAMIARRFRRIDAAFERLSD